MDMFFFLIQVLPSPTTGAYAAHSYNWKNNSEGNQQLANFSFQTQQVPAVTASNTSFQSSNVGIQQQVCLLQPIL